MRSAILVLLLAAACKPLPSPKPPINQIPTCTERPKIAASCPGIAMYGVSPACMRCWRTDYYKDDPAALITGCYSYELDVYCTNLDGCDDALCAPQPIITPPQSPEEQSMLGRR